MNDALTSRKEHMLVLGLAGGVASRLGGATVRRLSAPNGRMSAASKEEIRAATIMNNASRDEDMTTGLRAPGQAGYTGTGGNSVPEGLAYRIDLPEHLAGPDGFTKSGQLSGAHNLSNATAALDGKGATYSPAPTPTNGIFELSYNYVKPTSNKTISGSKTVYDSSVFSDRTMLN